MAGMRQDNATKPGYRVISSHQMVQAAYKPCFYRVSGGVFASALLLFCLISLFPFSAEALTQSGCFIGRDHLGQPARVYLTYEQHGDWSEVRGQIQSSGTGQVYQFKADGYSWAGRAFQGHEYESGAVYIQILELTPSVFVLQVKGYGIFRYKRSRC